MLSKPAKTRRHTFCFLLLGLAVSYLPVRLLAQEYQYTETGRADSTSNGDSLAIIQNQLVIELPAPLHMAHNASLSWQHRYTQLQQAIVDPLHPGPLHNGHLHYSRVRWQANASEKNPWRHDWSFGLAMSSNRFKNIEPDQDGLVLEGSTFAVLPLGNNLTALLGIQANYLYNRYRMLPDVGLQWQSPLGEVALGTRAVSWIYDLSSRQRISVTVARAASKWFAEDNDSRVESEVYLRTHSADFSYRFELSPDWAVRLGLGYTQVRRLSFQDRLTGPVNRKFDGAPTFSMALIRF